MFAPVRVALCVLLAASLSGCEKRNDNQVASAARPPHPTTERSAIPAAPSSSSPRSTAPSAPQRVELVNAELSIPEGASASKPVPFILLLHGLGDSGARLAVQIEFQEHARVRRFAYAAPDGSIDLGQRRFWNAWHACCDFDGLNPDHVQALRELLDKAAAHPAIDRKRRYVLGYSNGGFMAHRLACEVPGLAAIASIAGSGPSPEEQCRPSTPTAVLQVHGDKDVVIAYAGGHTLGVEDLPVHPSAPSVMNAWAKRNGCGSVGVPKPFDLEQDVDGNETTVLAYPGCRRPVELWRIKDGEHLIVVRPQAVEHVLSFLERQTAE